MIAVAEAQTRILSAVRPLPAETVALAAAHGRVLAEDVRSATVRTPKADLGEKSQSEIAEEALILKETGKKASIPVDPVA